MFIVYMHSHSSGVGSDLLPFFLALARFSASPPSTTRGSREDCRACLALAELPERNDGGRSLNLDGGREAASVPSHRMLYCILVKPGSVTPTGKAHYLLNAGSRDGEWPPCPHSS